MGEQAPERQLIGAERVVPSVAKVHAAESSPSSKRARINKLKLAEPLGSVFDSDSTEVHGVSTEAATSPLSPQRLAEIEAKALATQWRRLGVDVHAQRRVLLRELCEHLPRGCVDARVSDAQTTIVYIAS